MISGEKIAEDIFKILKGNGHNIKIFTDEGENTVDPTAARRFYIPNLGSMINLDETDSKREIRISINANTDISEFKDTLALLKNLANRSIVEYTLKSFTKAIEPKDQDYQAQKARDMKQDVQEGIGAAYGSSKSSYQQLENAKLIIKHKTAVDETSRGSRSRNINAIYVENSEGERYKMPTNNLAGGRAMLRHVKEGGTPYDDFGAYIQEQCNELKKLKEFKKYSLRNGLVNEDTAGIVEAVSTRIASIRESINKLKGCKCYNETKEKFESKEVKINETDRNKLRSQFTVRTFDEGLDEALPYVNALVKEMRAIKEADNFAKETMDSLVDTIANMDMVSLRKGIDVKSDPENPMNLSSFGNMPKENQIAIVMEYLGNSIDYAMKGQDQLSVLLSRMSDEMERVKDRSILMAGVKAINSLFTKLTATASENTDVKVDWEETFESNFNNYDFNKLFS
tara:strand:- start:2626 stop:3990 length:1365 start_codon:yes stop_codon:yes gene_type:complete